MWILKWLRSIDWAAIVASILVGSFGVFVLLLAAHLWESASTDLSKWIHQNEHIVEALSTFIIAVFTITLWHATTMQAQLTRKSIDLARSEFLATHRPKVIVRFIQRPIFNERNMPTIYITVANIGSSRATIEAFGADLARLGPNGWLPPGLNAGAIPIAPIHLGSGQRYTHEVTGRVSTLENDFDEFGGTEIIYAIGEIRYRDGNGVLRETGFYRRYDNRAKKFTPSPRDDEEYVD